MAAMTTRRSDTEWPEVRTAQTHCRCQAAIQSRAAPQLQRCDGELINTAVQCACSEDASVSCTCSTPPRFGQRSERSGRRQPSAVEIKQSRLLPPTSIGCCCTMVRVRHGTVLHCTALHCTLYSAALCTPLRPLSISSHTSSHSLTATLPHCATRAVLWWITYCTAHLRRSNLSAGPGMR